MSKFLLFSKSILWQVFFECFCNILNISLAQILFQKQYVMALLCSTKTKIEKIAKICWTRWGWGCECMYLVTLIAIRDLPIQKQVLCLFFKGLLQYSKHFRSPNFTPKTLFNGASLLNKNRPCKNHQNLLIQMVVRL